MIVAYLLLSYANMTRKKEGPIYSSFYLNLSEEEQKQVDTDREYKRVTILYGLIGLFFVFLGLMIMTLLKVFGYLAILCLLIDVIYFFASFSKLNS